MGASPADETMHDSDEVSEPGSVLSMDSSEADAYIDDADNVSDSAAPSNVKDNALDAIIAEEYNEEQILPRLPPIDDKLAVVVTKWLHNLPSRDKVKELFKNCMLPSNVEGLQPVKINAIVYDKLNANYKVNDQRLRGLNTFITWGLRPIIGIWNNILAWETALNNSGSENVKLSQCMGIIQTDNLKLDPVDICRQLDKAIRLLSACNALILDRHRLQLRSFFDTKFQYLLKPSNPITSEFLGDNIDQRVVEAIKPYEAGQKIQFNSRPRFPRSRGRNLYHRHGNHRGKGYRNRQDNKEPFPTNNRPFNRTRGTQGRGGRGNPHFQNNFCGNRY